MTLLAVREAWEFGTLPPFDLANLLGFCIGKIAWPSDLLSVYPPPTFTLSHPVVAICVATTTALRN